MSPPAVSQQIRALEDHLGFRLFSRAAAGVTLTDDGRALLSAFSNPLFQIETTTNEFAQPKGKTLIIAASLMLAVGWLATKLLEFMAENQNIKVDLRALTGRPERPDPDVEIWVSFGPYSVGLVSTPLFGETLIPVSTPEIASQINNPADFLNYALIEPSAHETTWAHVLGSPVLPSATRVVKVESTLLALYLATKNVGIALARSPATDILVRRVGLMPCLDNFSIVVLKPIIFCTIRAPLSQGRLRLFKKWLMELR